MLIAHLDFETASPVELRTSGVYKQMEHPGTRVWGFRYFIGPKGGIVPAKELMKQWRPGWADPVDLLQHIAAGGMVVAHNAAFERTVWNWLLRWRYGLRHWPVLPVEQMDCTMARCAALAIPASLEIGAIVLGAKAEKDMEGNAVMKKMMRPRTRALCVPCGGTGRTVRQDGETQTCLHCDGAGETYTWWDAPELIERNMLYCGQDVVTEGEIDTLVQDLSPRERQVWMHDQQVNDRGVLLDIPTIKRAIKLRDYAKLRLNKQMKELTGGAVEKYSQTKRLVGWINSLGIACTSVAKDKQAEVLADADEELGEDIEFTSGESKLPHVVSRAMEVRRLANKTSTAKFTAMLSAACSDGRARGLISYHGTSTGRYAGRLIQPHNLYRIDYERDGSSIKHTVDILLQHADPSDAFFMMEVLVGHPMEMLAKALRTMFIAAPGNKLVGADLSNIEGRLAAWLAGEDWKLEAFRAYDSGTGADLYNISYARSFGIDVKAVTKAMRQLGKVQELSLGYQGSVGAFLNMGKNYGLKPAELVEPVRAATSPDEWQEMMLRYAGARDKHGLPQDQWVAVKIIVGGWRGAHPLITQSWWDLQDAAVEAVSEPGRVVHVLDGKAAYLASGGFLWCQLPSGRVLAYCRPRVAYEITASIVYDDGRAAFVIEDYRDSDKDHWTVQGQITGGKLKIKTRKKVMYEGYEGDKKRWGVFSLYGGMQFNHIDQGSARDVLVDAMFRVEDAGYPVVLHVHDEAVSEVGHNFGSAAEYETLIATNPAWLPGAPLASKGWEGPRYGK